MTDSDAWARQSASLIEVQKHGRKLEETVGEVLGWPGKRLEYDKSRGYTLQIDALYANVGRPAVFASTTYTSPTNKGHSNENKVQLKIGELALLKHAYPEIRGVLIIGGSRDAWLPYVLTVFEHFYDEVIYLWEETGRNRLRELGRYPGSGELKNESLWAAISKDWDNIQLAAPGTPIPVGLVRYQVLDALKEQKTVATEPSMIQNEIARLCFERSMQWGGTEWANYQAGAWSRMEMARSYFNPVEAVTELVLTKSGLSFEGGVARDVQVPSLLHDFGMTTTKMSEDFLLFSEALQMEVRIQCKTSGGGRKQHGKNIQNRAKEQIARSIFYRCRYVNGEIVWGPKNYHWIGVLDGDWGVTKSHPYKYIHMLQLAGYDKLIAAVDLLTPDLRVKPDNPLAEYLVSKLNCRRIGN